MSRLSSTDDDLTRPIPIKGPVLRSRRQRPLHPETIFDRLRARAAQSSAALEQARHVKWLLILWRNDGSKQYSNLSGPYEEVCSQRTEIMESGEYEKAWLILKTGGDK